jgi:GalNAc-alpha-(1->4)-GalNAc-alpha-(1->3)-diNAcBac-PP-undecaprenol alpha-1,4-N-acetyl-D-galactosaminyltransferase
MKKIKELIILYPSFEKGGATENLINFTNICAEKGIKIYLISNITQRDKSKFFNRNIKFYNVKSKITIGSLNRLITSINSIIILFTLLKKINNKNSLIVSFQSHILPIIFSKIFKRKIIIRNSEDILDATKYADYKISALFIYLLKIFFYNFSDGIITNAIKAKNSLDKILFKNKAKLIYNPYLKNIYKNKNNKRKKIILSVGRLCKQKNQVTAIKAFAHFLNKFPDYKLVIIGHGKDEKKLRQLCLNLNISKNVIFKGWVFNLKKYYLEAKILIFPSLYEGLPNTLIEAVNYNLPCISSRCSGAVDILSNRYGIFISNNQSIQLSNKMVDSILNYKKTLSNTQMIKKKLSRFLIKPQVLKYISFCNNILD